VSLCRGDAENSVWGAHERCSLEAMKEIARSFLPSAAAGCAAGSRLLAAFRIPDASYRMDNGYRYLIARA